MKLVGRIAGIFIVVACATLSVVFVELNPQETELAFGTMRLALPLGGWLVLFFVLGSIFTWLITLPRVVRIRWRLRRLETKQGEERVAE